MHRCNPDDMAPCNAYCQGTTHVDLAYCDHDLLAELGVEDALEVFVHHHARKHQAYGNTPCTILAMALAPEAPPMPQRYPQYGLVGGLTAYRVTYQVLENT